MPFPGALDDGFKRLKLRFPTELALDLFRGSNEAWRIARATRFFHDVDSAAGNFARGTDNFEHTRAAAAPEIVEIALGRIERENVGAGEIDNVDVIADASAIGCFVIGAEDFHVGLLPERDL